MCVCCLSRDSGLTHGLIGLPFDFEFVAFASEDEPEQRTNRLL